MYHHGECRGVHVVKHEDIHSTVCISSLSSSDRVHHDKHTLNLAAWTGGCCRVEELLHPCKEGIACDTSSYLAIIASNICNHTFSCPAKLSDNNCSTSTRTSVLFIFLVVYCTMKWNPMTVLLKWIEYWTSCAKYSPGTFSSHFYDNIIISAGGDCLL